MFALEYREKPGLNTGKCQGTLRLDTGILGLYRVWSKQERPREGKDSSTFIMAIYFHMHILTFAIAFKNLWFY